MIEFLLGVVLLSVHGLLCYSYGWWSRGRVELESLREMLRLERDFRLPGEDDPWEGQAARNRRLGIPVTPDSGVKPPEDVFRLHEDEVWDALLEKTSNPVVKVPEGK